MKKGDIVNIYNDPITHMSLEGPAKLVKLLREEMYGNLISQRWIVRFPDDERNVTRVIVTKKEVVGR